ncbi:MAG: hypothetical protein ACLQSR_04035, partial [Limisphaerales bacterium]
LRQGYGGPVAGEWLLSLGSLSGYGRFRGSMSEVLEHFYSRPDDDEESTKRFMAAQSWEAE